MANVLTAFKDAMGTSTVVLFVMAIVAWVLLPFAHPVYVVVVVPCIILGVAYAYWRARSNPKVSAEHQSIDHRSAPSVNERSDARRSGDAREPRSP